MIKLEIHGKIVGELTSKDFGNGAITYLYFTVAAPEVGYRGKVQDVYLDTMLKKEEFAAWAALAIKPGSEVKMKARLRPNKFGYPNAWISKTSGEPRSKYDVECLELLEVDGVKYDQQALDKMVVSDNGSQEDYGDVPF